MVKVERYFKNSNEWRTRNIPTTYSALSIFYKEKVIPRGISKEDYYFLMEGTSATPEEMRQISLGLL